MKAKIRIQSPEETVVIEIGNAAKLIGRGVDCSIQIKDDHASGKHCRICIFDTAVHIEDAGSKNGTYLNNMKIHGRTPFYINDKIRIGSTIISIAGDIMTEEEKNYFTFTEGTTARLKSSMQVEEANSMVMGNPLSAIKNPGVKPSSLPKKKKASENTAMIRKIKTSKQTLSKVIDIVLTLTIFAIGTSLGEDLFPKFPIGVGLIAGVVFFIINKKRVYTMGETLSGMKKIYEDRD